MFGETRRSNRKARMGLKRALSRVIGRVHRSESLRKFIPIPEVESETPEEKGFFSFASWKFIWYLDGIAGTTTRRSTTYWTSK